MSADFKNLKMRPELHQVIEELGFTSLTPVQAEASLQAATARLGASANLSRQGDRIVLNFQGVSGEALATWLEEVRVGARARPLEAAWQLGAEGAYQGTVTLSLGVGGAQ